jgi:hypothetical protein
MKMKTTLSLIAAAAVAMLAQGVYAQAASSPARADVKAEGKAAAKSGETKALETQSATAPAKSTSTKARADVKADTKTATKEGKTMKAGDKPDTPAKSTSTTARADVKADTKKATKEGKTMPAGEAPAKQ